MKIVRTGEAAGPRVIALGTFDGLHRGHRELIRQGLRLAEETGALLRVCTFDRHPLEILRPEAAPRMLQTPEERRETLEALGVAEMRILAFTRDTAETPPEVFLAGLRRECDLRGLVSGWNYTFGRGGEGGPDLLRREGEAHGSRVITVPPVRDEEGEIISSTAIREKLARGDVEGVTRMLGEPYRISGQLTPGGAGTFIIRTDPRKQLPATGAYLCRFNFGGESRETVARIGFGPDDLSGQMTVEVRAPFLPEKIPDGRAELRLIRSLGAESAPHPSGA